jgi:hypothetical protein
MDAFNTFNISTITLDVRISCDTFWNYKFNIPIRISDYYDANSRNNQNINNTRHGGSVCVDGHGDPMFVKLETYLVEYAIQFIYDDLVQKRQHRDIPILLKKSRKFHIHGRTLEDLLFPTDNDNRNGGRPMMPENIVYICTHC